MRRIIWEYKKIDIGEIESLVEGTKNTIPNISNTQSVLDYCNYAGEDGWELCHQIGGWYFFKRIKPEPV